MESLRVEGEADPERLLKNPERDKLGFLWKDPSDVILRGKTKAVSGYFEEKLLKDKRYRVGMALGEKGFLGCGAASEKLRSMAPTLPNNHALVSNLSMM